MNHGSRKSRQRISWCGLGKNLKLIALFEQPFYGARERILEFFVTLNAVVEGDNATIACIVTNIGKHFATIEPGGVVASDQIPHHDAISARDGMILSPFHPSVGRTEEVCVEIFVSSFDIAHINYLMPWRCPEM